MRELCWGLLLLLIATCACADEQVRICFNYGCASEQVIVFSEPQVAWVQEYLGNADTPRRERELLAFAVGQLYAWAGQQSPVSADRGGNYADMEAYGRMDCIDHSTTTTRFLHMLERRGALNFHRVLEPARRGRFLGLLFQHYSAQIEVIRPYLVAAEVEHNRRYVIDSWFADNGKPAIVMLLEEWLEGGGPDV